MPKPTDHEIRQQLAEIESIVRAHTDGITRDGLALEYERSTARRLGERTLRRRLEKLVASGKIVRVERGRAMRYRVRSSDYSTPASAPIAPTADLITVSPEGQRLVTMVNRPRSARAPVGYDREWLYTYQPGTTWYLPTKLREHLRAIGTTPEPARPAGTFVRDILDRLLIDLSWASSRLEGNTYSRLDTQNLIEFGQRAEGKDATEAQMILNHKAAIELLVPAREDVGINRATLLTLHALLSANLLANADDEGRLRRHPVSIGASTYTPIAIPQVIDECFARIITTAGQIPDPFECSFFLMVHLPYLQPFADVNKRTSRLAANISLFAANLCPLSFVDVPERAYVEGTMAVCELRRFELLRDVYAWAYVRSCAQYIVVRDAVVRPNPIRLRYGTMLAELIVQTVRAGDPPKQTSLTSWGAAHGIPREVQGAFGETAFSLLLNLNEGSAGRYGLRPGEFESWRSRFAQAR